MEKVLFEDLEVNFILLDYSPSHSQLVIRSKRNKQRDYNIDLIFKSVSNLIMPKEFNGIRVSLVQDEKIVSELIEKYGFSAQHEKKIYLLQDKSNDFKYYINSLVMFVYNNKLDILETSLGRYDFEDFNERVV